MHDPGYEPEKAGDDLEVLFRGAADGLVLPHDLDMAFDREVLRDRVCAFVRWAETRLPPACPATILSAATIDPEGLKRLLAQVIQSVYELAPPRHSLPVVSRDSAQTEREEKVLRVSQVLNGFLLLDEIVLGGWRRGVRRTGHTAALLTGRIRVPTLSQHARSRFAESATPGVNDNAMDMYRRLLTPQYRRKHDPKKKKPLPNVFQDWGGTTLARHQSIYDGLRMSADALDEKLSGDLLPSLDKGGDPSDRGFILAAKRVMRAIEQHELTMRLDGVIDAVELLRAAANKWAEESLAKQKRGHRTNQRKVTMLRRHVAYVCQYAWLLFGNRYADDVIDAAIHLSWLGRRLLTELQAFAGLKEDKPKEPPRGLLREFDLMALRPDAVPRWRSALGSRATLVGAFCDTLVGRQKEAWLGEHYLDQFLELRSTIEGSQRGRKKPEDLSPRRRQESLVNDLLVPMQAAGLAAQAPWDYLWDRASNPKVRLKSHEGKKWVVNPFGLLLAGDDAT